VLTRRPNDAERQSLTRLFAEVLSEFKTSPESATQLISAGESPRNDKLDASELAAWTMVTHLLLNLSETVTKG
jgi:hypothetical protein